MKKLAKHFHLDVKSTAKLEGYASINYRIETPDNVYVLKHYKNPKELELIQEESRILDEVGREISLPISTDVKPIIILEDQSFIRLIPFIHGNLLGKVRQNNKILFDFGKAIALLDKALHEKRSAVVEARKQAWDLQYCLLNKGKIKYIEDSEKRKLASFFLDLFEHHVTPKQDFLRHSIIHGDLNENNVLVKKNEIVGFIDFGDICYAPLINEVAIAMTYIMLLNEKDPISMACAVLKGYHEVLPLLKEEIELLYYLIAARLCVSVCNSSEAVAKGRGSEYILINQKNAWNLLQKYPSFSPIGLTNQFLEALGMTPSTLKTSGLYKKRKEFFSQSLSLSYTQPIHMTGAAFQYMYDNQGNTYLDAYNNIPLVGHCHPKISQVISNQTRKLNTNTRYLYDELTEYAEKLLGYLPEELNKIFFVNSGSAATDLALRISKNYYQREHFAVLEHGYHGNTMKAIEVSAYKFDGKGGSGKSEHIIELPLPNLFQGKYSDTKEYVKEALEQLRQAMSLGRMPAALLAEPISGCGGQVLLALDYLKQMKPFLEQHKILMICDEVQTGFGRLGSHFWGFELHKVVPDIVILGKPIGNGHPIGAVVCKKEIADSFDNGMEFFSSFGGNPVSCAIGSAVLDIVEEESLQQNALSVGNYYKSELKKLQAEFSCIADVRGQGLFLGIELRNKKGRPDTKIANTVKNSLKENFVLVSTDGPHDNVIKTKPPLCFTKENVDHVISLLRKILKKLI